MNPHEHRSNPLALGLATAAFTVCFFAWSMLGPLGPTLQKHLHISDFKLAVAVAIPVVLGSLMRIPLGLLTERFGGRRVFTALMAYTIVPLVLLALFHDSFGAVVALGFLLGVTGASFAVGVPYVNRWYDRRRQGFALGVYGVGMGGTVLTAVTMPKVAKHWGLAAPFWIAAGLMAVMTIVFWLFARDAPAGDGAAPGGDGPAPGGDGPAPGGDGPAPGGDGVPGDGGAPGAPPTAPQRAANPLRVFRRSPRAWALTLFYFLAFGGFVAMFLYLPKLLTGVYHLSKTDAGYRAAGFALLAVLARPAGGWLSDRISAERVLRTSFVATLALALGLAAGYRDIVPLTVCCLMVAIALGLGTGAVFKLVPHWYPREVGAVTGVVGAAGGLGGFFPPLVMALVKSLTGSYGLGFVLLAGVAALALLVLHRIERADAGPRTDGVVASARPVPTP